MKKFYRTLIRLIIVKPSKNNIPYTTFLSKGLNRFLPRFCECLCYDKAPLRKERGLRWLIKLCSFFDYSMMEATTPEATVLPPSRIAKRSPCSIAIGVMSSMLILVLSPGMHISVPSGRCTVPVTSVVLK